ncbi:MAG: hypothetical protein HC936_04045 [Leptolyngbyaceae cyanobacterium SU_3_3]|nr:hypothetical protein [Leptolyngbyaceae cyanobacterium SU_3_3]
MKYLGLGLLVAFSAQVSLSSVLYAQELKISPDNIVDVIVQASTGKNFVVLKSLCGKDSKPAANFLCDIEQREGELREEMLTSFALMKKTGNIRVDGDNKSLIPVSVFDKKSNKPQNGTIILAKTYGVWYLTDFLAEGESNSVTEEELKTIELDQSAPVISPSK